MSLPTIRRRPKRRDRGFWVVFASLVVAPTSAAKVPIAESIHTSGKRSGLGREALSG